MSTPSSFRATAAKRLAEDDGTLPAAISDFLADTRTLAVRLVPIALIATDGSAPAHTADDQRQDESLIESVRELGILEPILVRPRDGGTYELVAGRRRLLAARASGLRAIPAVVREIDDETLTRLRTPPRVLPHPGEVPAPILNAVGIAVTRSGSDAAGRPRSHPPGTTQRRIVREPRVISGPSGLAAVPPDATPPDGREADGGALRPNGVEERSAAKATSWLSAFRRFRRGKTGERR